MLLPYLLVFCRLVIGITFAISFLSKMFHFHEFMEAIVGFELVPKRLSKLAAISFSTAEIAVILMLMVGRSVLRIGFALAAFLLIVFCIALLSALIRKIQTSCNCFGPNGKSISPYDVWRNIGFILCAVCGWGIASIARNDRGNLSIIEWGLIWVVAAIFVTTCIQFAEIAQLFRQK